MDQKGVTNSPVTPFWSKIGARLAVPNSGPRGRTQRGARDAPQKQSHGPRDTHTRADEADGDARGTAPRRTPRAFPHGAGSGSPRRTGRTRGQRDRYAKQVRRGQHRETEVAQNVHVHVRAGTPRVAATAVACDGRHQCMGKCLHAVRRMQRDAQCQRTGAHARHTSMLHCTPSTLRRPRSACGKAYFVVTAQEHGKHRTAKTAEGQQKTDPETKENKGKQHLDPATTRSSFGLDTWTAVVAAVHVLCAQLRPTPLLSCTTRH